jgi:hypothetical protein
VRLLFSKLETATLIIEELDGGFYLYTFGKDSGEEFDTWHLTVADAQHQAEYDWPGARIEWCPVPDTVTDVQAFGRESCWKQAHIGIEADGVRIDGLCVWDHKWRSVGLPPVKLPHPAHPDQFHDFSIYEIGDWKGLTRFAAAELSAGIWGFYVPEKPN